MTFFSIKLSLDEKNKTILRDVDSMADDYLRKVRDLSAKERKGETEKIQKMFGKAKVNGDDKVRKKRQDPTLSGH